MKVTKTGNKRYRVHNRWFSQPLVVLQFEWKITGAEHWSSVGGIDCRAIPDYTEWRDARIEELTEEILG